MWTFYLQVADVNTLHRNLQLPCSQCYSLECRGCRVLVLMIIKSMNMKMKILCFKVCPCVCVCVCVCVRKAGREERCVCQCSAEERTKGPFIAVTHWQPLPMHLQCSQHILSGGLCTHTHNTHTHTCTHTHNTHTHTHSPLYLTEPNYRHLSLSDETKNCSIFRLMESDVSLSFSSSSPPLSVFCRICATPRRRPPLTRPPHPTFDTRLVK